MSTYNDAQGVAGLLSQFDFNIINEGPGDFSIKHHKYTCEFSKPGIKSRSRSSACRESAGRSASSSIRRYPRVSPPSRTCSQTSTSVSTATKSQITPVISVDASGKLEQDSHDGQMPEREDERGNGDAEH